MYKKKWKMNMSSLTYGLDSGLNQFQKIKNVKENFKIYMTTYKYREVKYKYS